MSDEKTVIKPAKSPGNEPAKLPIGLMVATGLCLLFGLGAWWARGFPDQRAVFVAVSCAAYLAGGVVPVRNAARSLSRGKLDVDLLMILAAAGAASIGDWLEGIVLLFLFSLSGALEAFAMYRTTRSIESLISLRPRKALRVQNDGTETLVDLDSLQIHDEVRVKPGERFPVDGVVRDGETWADESTLTGESEKIHKPTGAEVFAGTINVQGSVLVEMTKATADSTLERIVHLVQEAQAQKTSTQRFVESWQQPYVLGVLIGAVIVLFGARLVHTSSWHDAFYHAMVLLVAASPCAVVVSTPAVMLSAIARAGLQGILFKGAVHLERLAEVDTIALDKTGTVTKGNLVVTSFWTPPDVPQDQLLAWAACIERRSEHPLGVPVVAEAEKRGLALPPGPMTEFHSHSGLGVHARVGDVWVGAGREGLFSTHEISLGADLLEAATNIRERGQTALLVVAVEAKVYGVIGVADQIRSEAGVAIASFKLLGIAKVVILTGDHVRVANAVASQVNADEVCAGLLPEQKVLELRRLTQSGAQVAMVGDGVNDAPALAVAQVGIAMGGAGTDVALEVADVVLMRDDLRALPQAIAISRLARQRVRQNMIFAFGMIGILVLSTFFSLPLWLGVIGHEGSTVLVVFNGLRILWDRPRSEP